MKSDHHKGPHPEILTQEKDMNAQPIVNQPGAPTEAELKESYAAAMRITRARLEKDRRLKEVEREALQQRSHEVHTAIGD